MADSGHLIDVDLHVESRRSLAALHAALPQAQPFGADRPKWVHVAVIDALPSAAKRCWNE